MYKSIQIANYFISKRLATGLDLTPMKLVKLCYISHGWYCGFYSKPLLNEVICAWKYGPVIQSVYNLFRVYGNGQIDQIQQANFFDETGNFPMPGKEIEPFLDAIWNSYGQFNGIKLSAITHQPGTPWYRVWNNEDGKGKHETVIPNDYIMEYYKQRIRDSSTMLSS